MVMATPQTIAINADLAAIFVVTVDSPAMY